MPSNHDTDVLISGAGPTGLMLACQLARHGVDFILIDRHEGPSVFSKAMVVQARTLEFYDQMGIAARAIERGQIATAGEFHIMGEHAAHLPLGDIGTGISPFPYVLALGQDENERILTEWLARHGKAVQWQQELAAMHEEADHVRAEVRASDGTTKSLTARWIAGCDGAHSAVRHLSGIEFPGAPYEQVFFVADIVARGVAFDRNLNIFIQPGGFHLLFPMPGERHFRLIGIMPPGMNENPDLTFDALAAAIAPDMPAGFAIESNGWWSRYRISHRRAANFRSRGKGRAFLLGDAGHIHSPAGGQGMNTGLQDACNLGWKLALVCQGRAGSPLLDSYAHERERVAQRLVDTTDRAFNLAVSQNPLARLFRSHVAARLLSRALRRQSIRRIAFRTVSQTGIQYRDSPLSLSAGATGDVLAGDRLPWMHLVFEGEAHPRDIYACVRDTGFHLFLFSQTAADIESARTWAAHSAVPVTVHAAPAGERNSAEWVRLALRVPALLLVRPDMHIGYAENEFDAARLTRYLDGAFGTA